MDRVAPCVALLVALASGGVDTETLPPDVHDQEVARIWLREGVMSESQVEGFLAGRARTEVAQVDLSDIIALGQVVGVPGAPSGALGSSRQTVIFKVEQCLKGACGDTITFRAAAGTADNEGIYVPDERAVVLLSEDGSGNLWSHDRYEVADGSVLRKDVTVDEFVRVVIDLVERRSPGSLLRASDYLAVGVVTDYQDAYSTDVRNKVPAERYIVFDVQRTLKGDLGVGAVRVDMHPHGTIYNRDVPSFSVGDTCALFLERVDSGSLWLMGGRRGRLQPDEAARLAEVTSPEKRTSPD